MSANDQKPVRLNGNFGSFAHLGRVSISLPPTQDGITICPTKSGLSNLTSPAYSQAGRRYWDSPNLEVLRISQTFLKEFSNEV